MRFHHPVEKIDFEIPNQWWFSAKAHLFERSAASFVATSTPDWPTELVPIQNITAPKRNTGVDGLREERTISLLQAMISGLELPPLEVCQPPQSNLLAVRDGFHRYFISVALGFPMLPVSVRPYFDIHAR